MNSTLQRIEELNHKVSALETVLQNTKVSQGELDVLKASVTQVTSKMQNLLVNLTKKFNTIDEYLQLTGQRTLAGEESITSLGKMLTALVSELSDAKLVDQSSIMRRLRLSDEAAEKERIEAMVQAGVLEETKVSTDSSTLVVSQYIVKEDESLKDVANYRVIELAYSPKEDEVAKRFINKSAGDTISYKTESGQVLVSKIEAVYKQIEKKEVQGEQQVPEEKVAQNS